MSDETEITGGTMPYHIPALLPQCMEALQVRADGVYIDCTLGGGGHVRAAGCRIRGSRDEAERLVLEQVEKALSVNE